MHPSVYDLKDFYASHPGRLVRRLLTNRIREIWPDLRGQRLMGYGYAPPYLRPLMEGTERTFAVMPAGGGAHVWPEGEANLACLAPESQLPVETESVDRILMVHGLEHAAAAQDVLHEMWRVLKSNGRLLMIVPSRMGLWARADWTPFGHGTPFTASQINHYLQESLFVHERTEKALYMPPFRSFFVLRSAYAFENIGRAIFPGLSGVHLIEAGKQVYAPSSGLKQAARAGGRRYAVRAVPTS